MKQRWTHSSITVNNKRYSYRLKPVSETITFIECAAANIAQEFPNEDVPALLFDLPELIIAEKKYEANQQEVIRFRVNTEDKKLIEQKALEHGFKNVSTFLRELALKA